jgi:hypothetical protein
MTEKTTSINYLFYLQTKPELDSTYYLIAEILTKLSISLLPIEADELRAIDREKKHHVIVVRNDMASAYAFKEIQKTYLDTAMASGKVIVYDVSSFSELEKGSRWENKSVYKHYQLPLSAKQIAMTVAVEFYKDRNLTQDWPGGRRSKLPSMTNES